MAVKVIKVADSVPVEERTRHRPMELPKIAQNMLDCEETTFKHSNFKSDHLLQIPQFLAKGNT